MEDLQREMTKNIGPSVEVVQMSEHHANLDEYGAELVSIEYLMPAFREKQDCTGEP